MRRQLKNKTELFDYLMYGYIYELEDVPTKRGMQKRLKDNELEEELKNKTKENIKLKDLSVELKLGPNYNRSENPWIQVYYTRANKSGTNGRYVGVSFNKETNEIELWNGFGRGTMKLQQIYDTGKEYKIKYSLIEPTLKYGFSYIADCYSAVFIEKKYNIKNFNEEEFERDLEYITDLYKAYEARFENITVPFATIEEEKQIEKNKMTYEEINEKMLMLIEQVGNLAKAIREMQKDD